MFQENLKRLVGDSDGAVAGLLMGFDGIAVESFTATADSIDIQTVGMEFSFILTQVRKAAEILEVGAVQGIAIRTATLTILIRVLSSEYFLALALRPEGNFGKARFLLRLVAPELQAELAS